MNDWFIFTQARLNSQRLPLKMIKEFGGRNLWDIACEKLHNLPFPKEQKWVSVYEPELIEIAERYDISIYLRSKESANSDNDVAKIWEICQLPFKRYVMFNPCLPILSKYTIEDFTNFFVESRYNSAFGVYRLKNYTWDTSGNIYPIGTKFFNTKEFDQYPHKQTYVAAHCLYAGQCEEMRRGVYLGSFRKNDPALYFIENKMELFDVDDEEDFRIAEAIYKS